MRRRGRGEEEERRRRGEGEEKTWSYRLAFCLTIPICIKECQQKPNSSKGQMREIFFYHFEYRIFYGS